MLERPTPWPEALIVEASEAVLEVAERLGRLNGLAGSAGAVEMSPELARAVETVRAALASGSAGGEP